MAEIVNLRQARKARQRSEAGQQADANRAKFGHSKGERQARNQEATRAARLIDGAKREPD